MKLTPRTSKDRWQETHNRILSSAERLFASKGFNGTSMNDIVSESGLSKGAIYSHFESKERLFLSLWERQTTIGIEQLRQMFSPEDTAVDKLLKVAEVTMVSSCNCPQEVVRIQLEFMIAASRMAALGPDLQKRYETIHRFIVDIVEEGIKNGEFKSDIDSRSLTSLLFATFEGLSLHYATLGIEFDSKKLQETLANLAFKGILSES